MPARRHSRIRIHALRETGVAAIETHPDRAETLHLLRSGA